MCAECHSTGLRKNYDAKTDRFATTWAEISVGCETCHGQGSRSRRLGARSTELVAVRQARGSKQGTAGSFRRASRRRLADRSADRNGTTLAAPATLRKEVETCGLCHARRAGFHEDWVPGQSLSQTHVVEPLARTTYHADGQIRDVEEPYNYTPFKQSKMFAAGVTCSDCHEPHSAKLRDFGRRRLPAMPCLRQICRRETSPPRRRRSAANMHLVPHADPHLHGRRSSARSRVSRPAARSFGHARHAERVQRLPHATSRRNGPPRRSNNGSAPTAKGLQTYGAAFHAARTDRPMPPRCSASLAADRNAPAVARASALGELASRVSPGQYRRRREQDLPIPIRWCGSARSTCWRTCRPTRSGRLHRRFLSDPVRGVRIRAASLLAAVPAASQPQADRARFDAGGEGIRRCAALQRRAAGGANHAWRIFLPSADRPPRPRLNTRLR